MNAGICILIVRSHLVEVYSNNVR